MRKILIVFALPVMLSGCGLFKAREVNKTESSFSQVKTAELKTDSSVKEIDKSITVETKKGDSVFKIPEKKTKTETPFDWSEIIEGLTFVDSSFNSFTIRIDTNEKKLFTELTTPGKDLHLNVNESKTTYNDKSKESNSKTSRVNKEATEAKNSGKSVVAKPRSLFWLWVTLASLGITVLAARGYFKSIKNKSPV